MVLEAINRTARKFFATNQNSSGFTAKTCVNAQPSNDGFLLLADQSVVVPSRVRIFFIGVGSNNDVYDARLWAWYKFSSGGVNTWFPSLIGTFTITLSAFTGVASGALGTTDLFADTIAFKSALLGEATLTADTTRQGTTELFSPANDTPAWIELDTRAPVGLELDTDQTTNTPTANALAVFL